MRCYSASMPMRQPSPRFRLPDIWLISDARNDAQLDRAIRNLPRGSGVIFRHYHLAEGDRRARFAEIAKLARGRGHGIFLSDTARQALRWGADGAYGPPERLANGPALPRLVTAHSLSEIGNAGRARADAILLSPVFATRSHPGAKTLGPVRFHLLAKLANVPIIALGGMDRRRARAIGAKKWAAIDGI